MSDCPSFLGVECRNRSVLASGILGVTLCSLKKVLDAGAGIVTTKSIGPERRKGHRGPVLYDWGHGLINAVGLSNPGIDEFCAGFDRTETPFPMIVSIFGRKIGDFPSIAGKLEEFRFPFLELNLSCPNVLDEFGAPFAFSEELTAKITKSVKDTSSKKLIVKLSPNAPNSVSVAQAAQRAGADALCVMNTLGPGMVIHTAAALPVLGNGVGGISGVAILPLTVKNVYELYDAVSIPIIGTGGITDTDSALQMLMAGAQLYGIGSAVHFRGLGVFMEIEEGISQFLYNNGFQSTEEIIGLAHRRGRPRFYKVPQEPLPLEPRKSDLFFLVLPVAEVLEGEVKTLFFEWKNSQKPRAGQFFMLWIPGEDQKPFSVSYFDGERIGFSVQERGGFSEALVRLREGDSVGLLGPLGNGFDCTSYRKYLLVGGGIGLAPLLFAAGELVRLGKKVTIFAGGKKSGSVRWGEALLDKAGYKEQLELLFCTEDGTCGSLGLITDHLQHVFESVRPDYVLLCGPELFMSKSLTIFKQCGVSGEACIERMMKCGIGICGSCCIDDSGDRVCMEGPVFSFEYLRESWEFGRYRRDESGSVTGID